MSEINVNHGTDEGDEEMERVLRAALQSGSDAVGPPSIVDAAAAAGLLDVAYARLDSPVGPLVLASTPQGLARLAYIDEGQEEAVMEDIAARLSPRILSAPRRLDEPRRELDEYFAGRRRAFDVTLDLSLLSDFTRRVLTATAEIPYGEVATYKEVATAAGSPRGFRAAGNALGSNPLPIVLPCHRVLHSGGGLGGYTGGLARKRVLLGIEGHTCVTDLTQGLIRSGRLSPRRARSRDDTQRDSPVAAGTVSAEGGADDGHVDAAGRVAGAPAALRQADHGAAAVSAAVRDAVGPGRHQRGLHRSPDVLHPGEGARILEPLIGRNSVILLDEDEHLEQRRLLLPAFHGERMQRLTGLMTELAEREVATWPTDELVALHPRLQRVTLEIILRVVFGLEEGAELDRLRDLLTNVLAFTESPLSVLPPMMRALGWTTAAAALQRPAARHRRAHLLPHRAASRRDRGRRRGRS